MLASACVKVVQVQMLEVVPPNLLLCKAAQLKCMSE